MRKIIYFISFLILNFQLCHATKYALVIGIGSYPTSSGWININGDKDIPVVKDMLHVNGFSEENIVELKNENATAKQISDKFVNLINKVNSGDVVYIHFSGHGQQVTDLNGDEEDSLDEAWIPYDACFAFSKGEYEGENHILDDKLNIWLTQLRSKVGSKGMITVVADACHSGGGSRATSDNDYVIRGASDNFIIPTKQKATYKGEVGIIDWIFISACKSYQSNYEYNNMGSLTYALTLQGGKLSSISYKEVQSSIRTTIRTIVPFVQTPVVEIPTISTQQSLF